MHWFPFYSSDFIGATVGLSCLERSLYALMIPLYYEVGPFPPENIRTYRIIGCESDEQKRAVDFLLGKFFVLREDGWYQERAEKEKAKSAQVSERARQKVNKRWEAAKNDTAVLLQNCSSNTTVIPSTTTTTTTTTEGQTLLSETSVSDRYPACPIQALITLYHETLPACPRVRVKNAAREANLRARWKQIFMEGHADTAEEALVVFGDYFKRVGKSKFLTGQGTAVNGRKPFIADLTWLVNAANFAKVVERGYA